MNWGSFANIYFLLIPLFILFLDIYFGKSKKRILKKYPYLKKMNTKNLLTNRIKHILIFFGFIFLIVSLMQPQWGVKKRKLKMKEADIIFAMDVSKSMLARDIKPSRLVRAKSALSKILDDFYGNFVSLIAFAGESKVIVPLTYDYNFLKYTTSNLNTESVDIQGTNFKDLLEKTVLIFKNTQKKRHLIIITDGEDNEGNIKQTLDLAKNSNIKISTIGVGSAEGSRIPIYNKKNKIIGFKKNKQGNYVFSKVNPELLERIATATGGYFYFSNNIQKALNECLRKIKEYDTEQTTKLSVINYKEKFYYFALISFFLFFTGFFLPTGKKIKNQGFIISIIIISIFAFGFDVIDKGNHHNNKGVTQYKKGEFQNSLAEFQKAKDYVIYDKKLDLNIGDAFYKLNKYDRALNYFSGVISSKDKKLKKYSYYNLGNTFYKSKQFTKAVEAYKNVLRLDPSFTNAKKNLELTLKKLKENKNKQKNEKQDKNKPNKKQKKQNQQTKKMKKKILENFLKNLKKQEREKNKKIKQKKGKRANAKKDLEEDW